MQFCIAEIHRTGPLNELAQYKAAYVEHTFARPNAVACSRFVF